MGWAGEKIGGEILGLAMAAHEKVKLAPIVQDIGQARFDGKKIERIKLSTDTLLILAGRTKKDWDRTNIYGVEVEVDDSLPLGSWKLVYEDVNHILDANRSGHG